MGLVGAEGGEVECIQARDEWEEETNCKNNAIVKVSASVTFNGHQSAAELWEALGNAFG